jgi:hypothetical protein
VKYPIPAKSHTGMTSYRYGIIRVIKQIQYNDNVNLENISKNLLNLDSNEPSTYMNPNPDEVDPNDPEPDQERSDWALISGFCVKIPFHKTSYKWDLWLFIDQRDNYLCQCYEKVRHMLFPNMTNVDSPFFLNSIGSQLITDKVGLNMKKFDEVTGCVGSTGYLFRDMFVNFIYDQNDVILKENARFSACHDTSTAEKNYVNEATKQSKSVTANKIYRGKIGVPSTSTSSSEFQFSSLGKEQEIREFEALSQITQKHMDERLRGQKRLDESIPLTKDRIVSDATKVSFFEAIASEDKDKPIHAEGLLIDMFLKKPRKDTKRATPIAMRMMDILPLTDSLQLLHQHFYRYCEIQGSIVEDEEKEVDLRMLEEGWVGRILEQHSNLMKRGSNNCRVI